MIFDETISSELENMFSMPYVNLGLNVVLQGLNGYRGSKWSIIHFIWENGYDMQGMHLCHRKYGHTCREKILLSYICIFEDLFISKILK